MNTIDVIVPVYNVEQYLKKCVDSILNQTYLNLQIILVDDGSIDGSGKICDEYEKLYDNIHVIHKKNEGSELARIAGAKIAKSKYIMFVDSDDWIDENFVSELIGNDYLEYDLIIGNICRDFGSKREVINNKIMNGNYDKDRIHSEILSVFINGGSFQERGIIPSLCSKIIKRDKYLNILPFHCSNINYGEDFDAVCKLVATSNDIKINNLENSLYHYRYNPSSITNNYFKNMNEQIKTLYDSLFMFFSSNDIVLKQLMADYICAVTQSFKNELKNDDVELRKKEIYYIKNDERFKKCRKFTNISTYGKFEQAIITYIDLNMPFYKLIYPFLKYFYQRLKAYKNK
ncbi:MAG: glycosyltransferase family 2 protein [Faecalibacillus intestinalis]|uniref:glycosyltransferase family 2 protein n=1 Tax=Faecalibacillus intestinalis TaxID=1982626 RepID=UPI0039959FD7